VECAITCNHATSKHKKQYRFLTRTANGFILQKTKKCPSKLKSNFLQTPETEEKSIKNEVGSCGRGGGATNSRRAMGRKISYSAAAKNSAVVDSSFGRKS